MKQIILFLCILSSQLCLGQSPNYGFYIVNDQDGWANVRDNGKVIDKLDNNKIVFIYVDELLDTDTWIPVEYEKSNTERSGFIHKSRLKSVSDLEEIQVKQIHEHSYLFGNESFSINIKIEPFDPTNRVLKYSNEGPWLVKIDNRDIWGVDGGMPKTQYKSIEVVQNGREYSLPKSSFSDLFEPSLNNTHIFYDKKTDILYITTMNGDGAGGCLVAWSIENGKYKERLVTHGF